MQNKVSRDVLSTLKVGAGMTFNLGSYAECLSARSLTWTYGLVVGRKYTTRVNSKDNSITIIRVK